MYYKGWIDIVSDRQWGWREGSSILPRQGLAQRKLQLLQEQAQDLIHQYCIN